MHIRHLSVLYCNGCAYTLEQSCLVDVHTPLRAELSTGRIRRVPTRIVVLVTIYDTTREHRTSFFEYFMVPLPACRFRRCDGFSCPRLEWPSPP